MSDECDITQRTDEIWSEGHRFLDSGSEADAINSFTELVRRGDWRGAYMLGWLSEEKGREFQENYIKAANFYSRALLLAECPPPHEALGRYYYFGLGGYYDYEAAFEHLQKSDQNPVVKIMTAELLAHGLGVEQDVERASALFRDAGESGYPAGWMGLMSLAKRQGNYLYVAGYFIRSLASITKLVIRDRNDHRLSGVGGDKGTLRRNWVRK